MSTKSAIVVLMVLLLAVPVQAAGPPREPLVEQVRHAIDRGIQFLRDQENGTGNWEHVDPSSQGHRGGWTALALLALLNAGVKPDDPMIERGLRFLRELPPRQTYVVSLQTMVFAEAGKSEDRERIQRNVDWLIAARVYDGGKLKGWTYGMGRGTLSDNSNTQYALLGLHAGQQVGARINHDVWEGIREYYLRTQQPDHGWLYNPALPSGSTLTMTTAGLCGLLISGMELNAGRQTLQPDGSAVNCGVYAENKPVAEAMAWVGRNFRIELPYNVFYNLYGIERAGRLSGQRFLGEHDWYRRGCTFLVQAQKDDGSWMERRGRDGWPVVSTSFALLFLSKGRTAVPLAYARREKLPMPGLTARASSSWQDR
jgi:hypothetical protein